MAIGNYSVYPGTTFPTTTTSAGTATIADPGVTLDPIITRCSKEGHVMHLECELVEDGSITGLCQVCGEYIRCRRVAGGLTLLRLRKALEDAVSGHKEFLAEEYLNLADEVDAEERALQEAKSLLRLAGRALMSGSAA